MLPPKVQRVGLAATKNDKFCIAGLCLDDAPDLIG